MAGLPVIQWGSTLINKIMPMANEYIKKDGRDYYNYMNKTDFGYFEVTLL